MAKYKRKVSVINPPEKYVGPLVKEDFVKNCPPSFPGGDYRLRYRMWLFLLEDVTYVGIGHCLCENRFGHKY